MDQDILGKDIRDFFEAKGAFKAELEDLHFFEGSSKHAVFISYFEKKDKKEREFIAEVLVKIALGNTDDCLSFVGEAMVLIVTMCINGKSEVFLDHVPSLEKEFNKKENQDLWLSDSDLESEGKSDWHYGLALFDVLFMLNSKRISETFELLSTRSKSDHFRWSLKNAKQVLNRQGLRPR